MCASGMAQIPSSRDLVSSLGISKGKWSQYYVWFNSVGFSLVMMEDHSGMKVLNDGDDILVKGAGILQRERSISPYNFFYSQLWLKGNKKLFSETVINAKIKIKSFYESMWQWTPWSLIWEHMTGSQGELVSNFNFCTQAPCFLT